jgi:peptidyl-prolyl cis-trans isomerase D
VLRFLRRYSQSTVVKVLYGLLAVVFVFWGAGMLGMGRLDTVAEVYGDRITQADLGRETELLQRRLQALAQNASFAGLDLRAQALDALIERSLLRHEADRLSLVVTENDVIGTITAMPELQRDGRFDRELLERILRVQRDRGEFETEVRQDILTRRFRDLVLDAIEITPAEVEAEYRHQNEQVSLLYARISGGEAAADATPTDQDLEQYRLAHQDRYLTPPTTRARYVVFAPGDHAELAAPSPAQIEAFYEEHRAPLHQARGSHRVTSWCASPPGHGRERAAAAKRAADLLARARGEDFTSLAKHSDDPHADQEAPSAPSRGRMVPAFDTAAFALQAGKRRRGQSPFGLHIIRVERHDGGPQDLAAVRDETEGKPRGARPIWPAGSGRRWRAVVAGGAWSKPRASVRASCAHRRGSVMVEDLAASRPSPGRVRSATAR